MPPFPGFCGPSNPSQSVLADAEQTMNWYVEAIQSKVAPTGAALYPTPGFQTLLSVPEIGMRAGFDMNGRTFGIWGNAFYEIFPLTKTTIKRGTVAQDNNLATICSNGVVGNQLGVTSGGNWYTYDLTANTLTQVAALTGKATMGGMKDGYFLCFNVNTGTVFVSNLNDGLTWQTSTMYFQRAIAPDPWKAMVVGNPQIYMIGEQTTEAWYNAGNSPQPFAPILSSFMQCGTPAPFAAAMMEDALTFMARDKNGQGVAVQAKGYVPTPISNYAVETAIQSYARSSTINDTELLVYQDQGHLFGCFTFPNGNATWVVDPKAGALWHQRGTWVPTQNQFNVWSPRVHVYSNGLHLVGDRTTGNLNVMDVTYGAEADGSAIRRFRSGPPLWATSKERLLVSRFGLQVDVGLGTASGQGVSPQVMLRTTTNGRTWSPERLASAGAQGQYNVRVYWLRCGASTKIWVPSVSTSDPIPWRISGAEIEGSGFASLGKAA